MIRPILSLKRLSLHEGQVVYQYGKHSSERESMDYLEFIARVTSHIPDKGQVPLEGEKLRFPPSNGRSAPCLPFSSFALRPKGHTPLDPPDSFLETKQSGQHLRSLCQCPQRACPCGSREKMRKTDVDPLCPLIIEDEDPFISSGRWAEMIKKVYEIDPLICPQCGGIMRIVSFIEDHKIIDKIIKHLNLTFKAALPPPPQAQLSIAAEELSEYT
ncbi:transposase [bacterium]|nr:transposase [bacterium]